METRPNAEVTALASGSGDHAELVERLTAYDHCSMYDGSDWEDVASEAAAGIEALLAENAALRGDLAKTERDYSELRDSYDRVSNKLCVERAHGSRETKRATEAERKLAEAVGLLEPFAKLADEEGGYREDDRLAWGLNTADINWGDLRAARTFLSKEAERG